MAIYPSTNECPSPTLSAGSQEIIKEEQLSSRSRWSSTEDELLRVAIKLFGETSWKTISEYVGTRDNSKCNSLRVL